MGSTRKRTAGLAAFALVASGLFAAPVLAGQAAAQHSQREGVANSKADLRSTPRGGNVARGDRSRAAVQPPAPVVATDNSPSATPAQPSAPPPARPSPRPAPAPAPVPAPAPAPAAPAIDPAPETPAPGLSADAPEVPPTLGVVGGGGDTPSGPSPAATPEPSTLLLMGTGLVGLYRMRQRR